MTLTAAAATALRGAATLKARALMEVWNIAAVIPVERILGGYGGGNGGSNISFSGELVPEENFLGICNRELLARGCELLKRTRKGKLTRVAAFPIGIDSERFIRALALPEVQNHLKDLKERFAGRKDRSLDFHALCALYAVTDVALSTSLRDGMNLVSYEFAACLASKKGVLILSEFAGVAQSLGAGSILVNPWNITEVAASIGYALDMPADEREKRHQFNFKYVTTHTSQEWAATFVSELNDTIVEAQLRKRQVPPLHPNKVAVDCYSKSNNRLIILGFNSTLTEPVDTLGMGGQI